MSKIAVYDERAERVRRLFEIEQLAEEFEHLPVESHPLWRHVGPWETHLIRAGSDAIHWLLLEVERLTPQISQSCKAGLHSFTHGENGICISCGVKLSDVNLDGFSPLGPEWSQHT